MMMIDEIALEIVRRKAKTLLERYLFVSGDRGEFGFWLSPAILLFDASKESDQICSYFPADTPRLLD